MKAYCTHCRSEGHWLSNCPKRPTANPGETRVDTTRGITTPKPAPKPRRQTASDILAKLRAATHSPARKTTPVSLARARPACAPDTAVAAPQPTTAHPASAADQPDVPSASTCAPSDAPSPPTPSHMPDTVTATQKSVPNNPPSVTKIANSVTPPVTKIKKKPGPKKSGNALTPAEKQRAYRARKKVRNGPQSTKPSKP